MHFDQHRMTRPSTVLGQSHICETCRLLDFNKAFSVPPDVDWKSRRAHPGVLVAKLGARPAQISACEVCHMLWNSAFWPEAAECECPLDTSWELRAYSVDETSFPFPSPDPGRVQDRGVCLTLVPEHQIVLAENQKLREFLWKNGHIVCSRSLHLDEPGKRKPRLIPRSYDSQRVKSWLRMCRAAHGIECNQGVPLMDFRLIDCTTLVVVDATNSMSWVALSYV
ncbi:hypothetical protein EDB81DRAFT_375056 [Dactylonectria macrodidyma]|uniref:Uncharacterized protein n=1 Tax=Dactylonectria macrodidyma TaxID=307937 RepID=A0A9P9CZ48_9HYPO|nr:hypothetical protein EDB81DRAFT_375056 [Dactylonectria macrodidyma]